MLTRSVESRVKQGNTLKKKYLNGTFSGSSGKPAWNKGLSSKIKFICKTCLKEFWRLPNSGAIFCSPRCQAQALVGIKRPDVSKRLLGNKLTLGYKHTEEAKRKISIAGHNRGTGKMALYPENERIRKSSEYTLWRKSVFARDNWTCQKYGVRGGFLVAHHINNFADFAELRLAIDNGITLCKQAHDEFHKIYGKHYNTRAQLEEFLTPQPNQPKTK